MTSVWVLGRATNESNSYNNRRLMSVLRDRGIDCSYYDMVKMLPESVYRDHLFSQDDTSLVYEDGSVLTPPDLVIMSNSIPIVQPSFGGRLTQITSILKSWQRAGIVFINDVESHIAASSKHSCYAALKAAGVPIPNTEVLPQYEESEEELASIKAQILQEVGFPLVVKPVSGYGGEGVDKCEDEASFNSAVEAIRLSTVNKTLSAPGVLDRLRATVARGHTETTPTQDELLDLLVEKVSARVRNVPIVVQGFESRGAGLMVSVRIVGDQLFACYCLGSPYHEDQFKSELAAGRMKIACNVDAALEKICKDAQAALNLDVFRMDLFVVDDGYKVCEVNCPGSFNRLDMANNLDQASIIVDYALSKLGR